MSNVRKATTKLIELVEEGLITWEVIATACLQYMSEADVADMAHCEGFIKEKEEEEDKPTEVKYSVVFRDIRGGNAAEALAFTFGGSWDNAVPGYDGEYDLAFVTIPADCVDEFIKTINEDNNIISASEV